MLGSAGPPLPGGLNMSFYNDPNGRTGSLPASYASTSDADEDAIEGIAANGGAVTVGSIDTGVDFGHPEFTGRLVKGHDFIDGDDSIWESTPLVRLAAMGEIMAFEHRGFWQPMDTLRDKNMLEELWSSGKAPWKVWH